jgi:hypothetical protein
MSQVVAEATVAPASLMAAVIAMVLLVLAALLASNALLVALTVPMLMSSAPSYIFNTHGVAVVSSQSVPATA